jgi:hypothetical protein
VNAEDLPTLWDFADPAGSEGRFRAAAASAAGDRVLAAEALTQEARAQGLQRRFEDADATLDRAETLLGPGPSRGRVRLLLERGRVRNSSGRRVESRRWFLDALEAAQACGEDGLAVDAAHMLGIAEEPAAALDWNLRAIAMAEASSAPAARRWLPMLCNNTAWTLHEGGRAAEALPWFEKALAEFETTGRAGPIHAARWAVAKCLRTLGRTAEALARQEALLATAEGSDDGFVAEELAECLAASGRSAEARPHAARARELLGRDLNFAADNPARLARLEALAKGE